MIRIKIAKNRWEEIKEKHQEWFRINVLSKINFVVEVLSKYLENNKNEEIKNYLNVLKIFTNDEKIIIMELDKIFEELNKIKLVSELNEIFKLVGDGDKEEKNRKNQKSKLDITITENWEMIKQIIDKMNLVNETELITIVGRNNESEENLIDSVRGYININIYKFEVGMGYVINTNSYIRKDTAKNSIIYLKNPEDLFIKNIFNYKKFQTEKRHEILSLMGIEVCPYCQRNHITNYKDENDKELTTADLDHFYPQAQYPYLALSLYNFIPSCHTCNSTMKNQDKIGIDTHIYPYTDSMERDIEFTIEANSFVDNVFTRNQNLNIDIDVISTDIEKNNKIENSLKTFKLNEVYKNSHSKYVGDLIHNFQKYPKSYTKALGEIFLEDKNKDSKEHQEKLQILNDNFQEIIKKPYIDKIEKSEPLAKLTKDIMEELGIK